MYSEEVLHVSGQDCYNYDVSPESSATTRPNHDTAAALYFAKPIICRDLQCVLHVLALASARRGRLSPFADVSLSLAFFISSRLLD